jgi:hypothetical protein
MRWKLFALARLLLWVGGLSAANLTGRISAQELTKTPAFHRFVSYTRFAIVGGRITNANNGMMFGIREQTVAEGPVRERFHLNAGGGAGSMAYSYERRGGKAGIRESEGQSDVPDIEFSVVTSSDGRFVLRYSDKDHPERFFNFTQLPGQPVSLSLPPIDAALAAVKSAKAGTDKPRVLRAPTVWHLIIINSDDCRKRFLPTLESLRPGWHVALAAESVEDELVKMAAVSRKSDRKQWGAWVRQMGDPLFRHRERADRNLREVGPAALGFLTRLNMNELDADQKSRVRAIIRFLSQQTSEDTPQRVAATLVEDPLIWLALLSRPEEATRRAAAQQLSVILDCPIDIDPKALPETQAKARETVRMHIEKSVGEGPRADDSPKPADVGDKTASPPVKR